MGHALGDQAGNAVKKSEKKEEKKARTDEEVFRDILNLLNAGLSIPPLDIRLLLTRYNEMVEGNKEESEPISNTTEIGGGYVMAEITRE